MNPLVFKVENSYSISVPIFKQFHKNIIGKGGANIKKVIGSSCPSPKAFVNYKEELAFLSSPVLKCVYCRKILYLLNVPLL